MKEPTTPEEMQGQADAVDPTQSLNIKKAKIDLLEAELSDVDAKLDAEFLEQIPSLLSDDEMDMRLDDDIRPFLAVVEEKREAFYSQKLDELKGRISTMKTEVEDSEADISIEEAKRAFLEAHPEADFSALTDFFRNDITPRQKEELYAAPDYLAMLEAAYVMYSKKNKPAKKEETPAPADQLPPDMNDAPSSAPKGDPSPVAKDDAYLARIGVRS